MSESRYKRIKKLGNGNQGIVWLVENKNTGVQAAMKVYPARSENGQRELDILRQFGGKGVPYLIDCIEEKETTAIVMEYLEGKTLRELMKQKKIWKENECVAIAYEIAKVLCQFHQQVPALIYGDLKPENMILGENGSAYLIDFGSVLKAGEKNKKVYGTKVYLPTVEDKITPYRDTYALGMIMYEMLTGNVLMTGIQTGKADISHVSPICRKIMQKAVRIRGEAGYQDAGQMCEALKKCKEQLEEEYSMKKVLRNWKCGKRKQDYYITDLKRVVLHGYKKGIGLLIALSFLLSALISGREINAAELEPGLGSAYIQTEAGEADEIPRDEYGRKLVIRK